MTHIIVLLIISQINQENLKARSIKNYFESYFRLSKSIGKKSEPVIKLDIINNEI